MKQKSTVYDIVTNKVIQLLEKGITPWRKPWKPDTQTSSYTFVKIKLQKGRQKCNLNH